MIKFLDLHKQYTSIQTEIDAAIANVISETAFVGNANNRFNKSFEANFAKFQGAKECVGVANGTDALEIALEALDLPQSSEVIVPANSFIASSEAVTRSGHRVVFADIDPVSYTLNIDDVSRRITPKTKAIMAVHLYGHPCNMDRLCEISSQTGIRIIEDCAQSHGAEFRDRRVGAIGDIGTFSFFPGKNLGGYGDGGAILTNNAALANKCRMIANHGRIGKYDHEFEGRNSRLDGLQAAILDVKLKYLDSWINARNNISNIYSEELAGLESITLPSVSAEVRHAFHLFVIRTTQRENLQIFLKERGIQSGIHYPIALPKLAAYEYLNQGNENLVANKIDSQLLSLPIGEHLSKEDACTVASAIRDFFATQR